jgi:hypothetical protein
VRSLHTFRMQARDWAMLGAACVVLAALVSAAHVL